MPMEIDSDPSNPDRTSAQCQNSSSKNHTVLYRGTVCDDIPQDIPEIKTMRMTIMCIGVFPYGRTTVMM